MHSSSGFGKFCRKKRATYFSNNVAKSEKSNNNMKRSRMGLREKYSYLAPVTLEFCGETDL